MEILIATLRSFCPLVYPAMGGLLSERSGVINIALEGFMLFGAFFGSWIALSTGNPWMGWVGAFVTGMIVAAMYAAAVIELKVDQIVAGTAFNLFAIGFIPFLSKVIFDSTGSTPSLPLESRFTYEPMIFAAVVLAVLIFFLHGTRAGLWLFTAGEHPKALQSSGISVRKVRWLAVSLGGGLAAWGGATLSLALASSYSPMMSAGRGFIALAALITAKWKPVPVLFACLLFAAIDMLQIRLQGVDLGGFQVPVPLIQILPYVLTLIVLAGFVGVSRPPKALGKGLDGGEIK